MMRITMMVAACVLCSLCSMAMGGVIVESSRVVFSAEERERSLMLYNGNDYPVVVQTWIDEGSPLGTPESAGDVPVIPLPGIFRLEPGEKKNLRLLATQLELPGDRESLYWLNLYEIPPADERLPPGVSVIKVAVRLQLKVFYRPKALTLRMDSVVEKPRFSLLRLRGKLVLNVENPTPYFITFSTAEVSGDGRSQRVPVGMLAPFSVKTLDVVKLGWQFSKIKYVLLDDDGNGVEGNKTIIQP